MKVKEILDSLAEGPNYSWVSYRYGSSRSLEAKYFIEQEPLAMYLNTTSAMIVGVKRDGSNICYYITNEAPWAYSGLNACEVGFEDARSFISRFKYVDWDSVKREAKPETYLGDITTKKQDPKDGTWYEYGKYAVMRRPSGTLLLRSHGPNGSWERKIDNIVFPMGHFEKQDSWSGKQVFNRTHNLSEEVYNELVAKVMVKEL